MKKIILILNIVVMNTIAQNDIHDLHSILGKTFNSELETTLTGVKRLNKRSLLIVTSVNCLDCVKYFKKTNKINFLFVLNYESLAEINRILATYEINKKYCYFATKDDLLEYKKIIFSGRSPMLLKKNNRSYTFYNYSQVDSLSKGFSDRSFPFL